MMGTEIFQIWPKEAEKMEIKDSTCILESWPEPVCTEYRVAYKKLGFVMEGNSTFTFE